MLRFFVLFVFCLINVGNAIVWITFAPISSLAQVDYGISVEKVNALSVCYMAVYLPASVLGMWLFAKFNLRVGILTGAALTAVGSWIRYGSAFADPANDEAYGILLFGQILAGIAQPLITNVPAKIAARFFFPRERDLATVVASMSNPIGIAIGTIIPPAFVTLDITTSPPQVVGMDQLLLFQACYTTAVFVFGVAFLKNRPSTDLPSATQVELMKMEAVEGDFSEILAATWKSVKACFGERHFNILNLSFALGLGIFNALTTLIEQITETSCATTDDASLFGGVMIGLGLLGAIVFGAVLDRTHQYRLALRVCFSLSFIWVLGLTLSFKPGNIDAIAAMFALLGFFTVPVLPVSFEAAVEVTHPVPEDVSSGILMTGGQVTGIIFIYSLSALIQEQQNLCGTPAAASAPFVYSNSSILLICIVGVATLNIFLFRGENKRLQVDVGAHAVHGA